MKKNLFLIAVVALCLGCSSDQNHYNNPYIPNYSFSISINENLPLYSGLKSPVNPIYIGDPNVGVKGIFVMKISDTDYRAWEACCPNQYPKDCNVMTLSNPNAVCSCDNIKYSLFSGVGTGKYPMKPYRVEVIDATTIRVYN